MYKRQVETAGQSGVGALVSLIGIIDAPGFRETVLQQREAVTSTAGDGARVSPVSSDANVVLSEIRDSLLRIESALQESKQG